MRRLAIEILKPRYNGFRSDSSQTGPISQKTNISSMRMTGSAKKFGLKNFKRRITEREKTEMPGG